MDIKLTQMEFDFSEPEAPEEPKTYTVELTKGWDGDTIHVETVVGVFADASKRIHELVKDDPCLRTCWTYTGPRKREDGSRSIIVDYGSYTKFGRITTNGTISIVS